MAAPTIREQKVLLALACELDRLNLQLSLRPAPEEAGALGLLSKVLPLVERIPGPVGRWSRDAAQGVALFRGLYRTFSP